MDTLVLSHAYEPVARVAWKRAMALLMKGKVEVIEEYEDWKIKTYTVELKIPSVVRLLRAIVRKPAVKFSRENVYARDKGRCQYCAQKVPRHDATYDHVIPRSQGGQTRWENIVISCIPCNQKKGGRTPEQARMKLLSVPVKPKSLPDHIRLTFLFRKNVPEGWKQWLQSYSYWNSELAEEK